MSEAWGQPAYRQIADDLRARISRGDYPIGAAIPSTSQLCEMYSVSATAARAAVTELRSEGLVRGQPGKAVYVVATPEAITAERVDLDDIRRDVDGLSKKVGQLARRVDGTPEALQRLQDDLKELRRHAAQIETSLMDLYARVGQPYPHEQPRAGRRDAGSKARRSAAR